MHIDQFFEGPASFGMRVRQLFTLIEEQLDDALKAHGVNVKSNTTGILLLLHKEGPQSVSDIAAKLQYSHQLATHWVGWLSRNDYVEITPDPEDRRRRVVALTSNGTSEGELLEAFLLNLEKAYLEVFDEVGLDIRAAVQKANIALTSRPIADRLPQASARKSGN